MQTKPVIYEKNTGVIPSILADSDIIFNSFMINRYDEDLFELMSMPRLLEIAALCICIKGEAEIVVEAQSYRIRQGDSCVILPGMILQIIRRSEDFEGYATAAPQDFFRNLRFPSATNIYLYIKANPCTSLNTDELQRLVGLCDALKEHDAREDHLYRKEMAECLMLAICFETAAIYQKNDPLPRQAYSRKNKLFLEFQQLIARHHHVSRNVDYYAGKLCVTSRYLSAISKEISGMTAADCINRVVLVNARTLLNTTEMTIQQVSEELNFPNPSFFTQYFKKNTGMTPKQYREKSS